MNPLTVLFLPPPLLYYICAVAINSAVVTNFALCYELFTDIKHFVSTEEPRA